MSVAEHNRDLVERKICWRCNRILRETDRLLGFWDCDECGDRWRFLEDGSLTEFARMPVEGLVGKKVEDVMLDGEYHLVNYDGTKFTGKVFTTETVWLRREWPARA